MSEQSKAKHVLRYPVIFVGADVLIGPPKEYFAPQRADEDIGPYGKARTAVPAHDENLMCFAPAGRMARRGFYVRQ